MRPIFPTTECRTILQERCLNLTLFCRKTPKIAGTWKQYSGRTVVPFFFRWIPANFLCFPAETGWKSLKKIRKISGRAVRPENIKLVPRTNDLSNPNKVTVNGQFLSDDESSNSDDARETTDININPDLPKVILDLYEKRTNTMNEYTHAIWNSP